MQFKTLILVFLVATSFTLIQQKTPVEQVRENIVLSYTTDVYEPSYFDAKYFPDTTVSIQRDGNRYTVKSNYGVGLLGKWQMYEAIVSTSKQEDTNYETEFKKIFGKTLMLPGVKMKYQYEDGSFVMFPFFSPDAVQTAFSKLYVKPNASINGYTYQKFYNLSLKEYVRDFTKMMSAIMSNKQTWQNACNNYLTDAKNNINFSWRKHANSYINSVFKTDAAKTKYAAFAESINVYTIGPLMRRQCDGTLPVMLNCLKTVLKDYDPQALALVKGF